VVIEEGLYGELHIRVRRLAVSKSLYSSALRRGLQAVLEISTISQFWMQYLANITWGLAMAEAR